MTNIEGVKKINELLEQNPGIDIMFMADSEIYAGEEYGWYRCGIASVEIDDIWFSERKECYKTGMSDIGEAIWEEVEGSFDFENSTDEQKEAETNQRIELLKSTGEIKKYILVELGV